MRYRKRPIEIEAIQWTGENFGQVEQFMGVRSSFVRGDFNGLRLHTLEGVMLAMPGDWIIRGVAGELYPCKPEIFEQTYERVE